LKFKNIVHKPEKLKRQKCILALKQKWCETSDVKTEKKKTGSYLKFGTVLQKPAVNCKIMYLDFSQFQPEYIVVINFMDSKVRNQLTDVCLASSCKM